MNCISGTQTQTKDHSHLSGFAGFGRWTVAGLLAILAGAFVTACSAPAAESGASQAMKERIYGVDYRVRPDISRGGAYVKLRISQSDRLLRELSMPLGENMISDIGGDGQISIDDDRIRWVPPADGGELRWFATINHLRGSNSYDAFIGADWALFRAEDVIPPTATRTLKRSVSRTRLMFDLPDGWSAVTEYFRRSNVFNVSNPDRRFDRPTGWIILGELGVRHENIAGIRVIVAAPVDQAFRRMDTLAMLNWTLPDLVRLLPGFPKRLTIVGAGEPMWRGGLSAPRSFYVHADRPLISENGTSTIMHETIHIGLGAGAVTGADWIVEGLAEYYSLEILRRSGTISEKRYRTAFSKLENWGKGAKSLCADPSTGEVTARAVTILAGLNDEIRRKSDRKHNLDDVMRRLAGSQDKVSIRLLRKIVADLAGSESEVLSDKDLNNCEN
ncbi:MAG: hypothetical protein ACE1Z7_09145 [Woeseiaceae bacterium]